ncbi:D-alanyl-D-alanine carboxypeptidase DacA [Compostibacillus humi]|uniref:serine-type D-Ala-D-Ala carboxypeptidase n=1 Tax=Compostibacillus humi TaxID=1245525 RepID=A0A8J2TPM1_9BACI|nr:serine hydrolase [Compostibacillus humi]GFZ79129.1 D-alanyl-D-alanine carboxypeptidase DacA [Compostibacillus humi]
MKHKVKTIVISFVALLFSIVLHPADGHAQMDINAESAILVDATTGKILYAKNADTAMPPASMTKMMTEYLVWEAIENGQISWDTTTMISDYAYSISANNSFSGVGLRQNRDYTVRELYEAMAINSDNATTIALAELIAGSEGEFVKLMNQKGEEMGLPDFKFVNSTGLENSDLGDNYPEGTDPNGVNLLSAKSAALLAYHIVNDYPEALEISRIPETEFDGQTIRNYNWMLPHDATYLEPFYYEGVDGLKTGYTELAEYCFTGTAIRNGERLISVVMKTGSEEERFQETAKLLDYGFNNFQQQELFPAGYQAKGESTLPVAKGKEDTVNVITNEAISIPVKANEEENYQLEFQFDESKLNEDGELVAPIEKGEVIGQATLVYDGEGDYGYITGEGAKTVDIVTEHAVEKANWFMLTLGAIGDFFTDLFTSAVDFVKGLFS